MLAPINSSEKAIKNILLVGSSSRLPKIKEIISAHIPNPNYYIYINSERAVAHGALIKAAMLARCEPFNAYDVKTVPMLPVMCSVSDAMPVLANEIIHRMKSDVGVKKPFLKKLSKKDKLMVRNFSRPPRFFLGHPIKTVIAF